MIYDVNSSVYRSFLKSMHHKKGAMKEGGPNKIKGSDKNKEKNVEDGRSG